MSRRNMLNALGTVVLNLGWLVHAASADTAPGQELDGAWLLFVEPEFRISLPATVDLRADALADGIPRTE